MKSLPRHPESDGGSTHQIRVLHVDDDEGFGDLVDAFLERELEAIDVVTRTTARDGFEYLRGNDVDCVVSDYDMPEVDGLEFLEMVRGPFPDLPFILFTGQGSEEIASEAISKGVTDYLQKSNGTEQYKILANRIQNSVGHLRTESELEQNRRFLDRVLNLSPVAVLILDAEGNIVRTNEHAEDLLGVPNDELTTRAFDDGVWRTVDEDGTELSTDMLPFRRVLETGEAVYNVEHGIERPDGETVWASINAAPLWDEAESLEYVIAVISDESLRLVQQQTRQETIDQLEGFSRVLSHDLGNALNIALGRIELAQESGEDTHFEAAVDALTRADDILDELTTAIQAGTVVDDVTTVDLGAVFEQAWETQETSNARKVVETDVRVRADETALLRMFENLIRNTFEHGVDSATVRVGSLPDGFYVEDDGPGIPESERENVFQAGHSTKQDGTGIGLPSIRQIALAHGWKTRITESAEGGARFEFTNVERVSEE